MVIIAEEGERQLAEKYFPDQEIRITGVGALNLLTNLRDLPLSTPIIKISFHKLPILFASNTLNPNPIINNLHPCANFSILCRYAFD